VPKRDLQERSALQVYSRVFQGLKAETENFIKNICIFYLNYCFNLLENHAPIDFPVRYTAPYLGRKYLDV